MQQFSLLHTLLSNTGLIAHINLFDVRFAGDPDSVVRVVTRLGA